MDIFKGGYAPKSWAHRDSRYTGALEYVYELSQGTKPLPIWVCGAATPKQPPVTRAPDEGSRLASVEIKGDGEHGKSSSK